MDADGSHPRTVEIDDIGPRPEFGTPEAMRWALRCWALVTRAQLDAADPELTVTEGAKLCCRHSEATRLVEEPFVLKLSATR